MLCDRQPIWDLGFKIDNIDVVNFVIEHEHYSYPEALRYVAKRYGIEIEEEEVTPEMQQELDERESMFALNGFVTKYFRENLVTKEEGKSVGLTYLKERDFRDDTIEKFEVGYTIDKWEDYSKHAIANGYKKEILVKTGLSIEKENNLIDRFRGRVIFPIHNLTGKVIGFGGRILSSEKSTAKYINSPESDIYNKSRVLYGIFYARNEIVKKNLCYLVEGYTDVISLHQAGIENVVASSGTSLTPDQIKLVKRFTPNITMLFDGDPAGIKASFRGIELILEQGMNVKVVLFPEGEDPDSYARSHRTSETEAFIKNEAVDFIKFKTNLLLDETVGDPAARASLIKEIVQTIATIPDGISRSVYIKECSTIMEVPEQTLMNELNKSLRRRFRDKTAPRQEYFAPPEPSQSLDEQLEIDPLDISRHEKELMRLLLLYGYEHFLFADEESGENIEVRVSDFIVNDLQNENIKLENQLFNQMLEEYSKAIKEERQLSEIYFANHPNPKIAAIAIELIATQHQLSENWKEKKIYIKTEKDKLNTMVLTSLLTLKSRLISKQLKQLSDSLKVTSDDAGVFILQQQYYELKNIAARIENQLTRSFHY